MEGFNCVPANFCNEPSIQAIRIMTTGSFNNWITEYDLLCSNPQNVIGFYLLMFTGIAIGGLFIAPVVDIWGKKFVLMIALFCMVIDYTLIIFATSY